MEKIEFHIVPIDELHDISLECECGYEVMGFSNGIIVIHQPEGSFDFDVLMQGLGACREWVLCQVVEE
jgi:hypothetical protein